MVNHEDEWESLEALMEARADIAIQRACVGFGIDFEEALRLIRKQTDLIMKTSSSTQYHFSRS